MVKGKNIVYGVSFFLLIALILNVVNTMVQAILNVASYDNETGLILKAVWSILELILLLVIPILIIIDKEG